MRNTSISIAKILAFFFVGYLVLYSLPVFVVCNDCQDVELITIPKNFKTGEIEVDSLFYNGVRQEMPNTWFGRFNNDFYLIGKNIDSREERLLFTNLNKSEPLDIKMYYDSELPKDLPTKISEFNAICNALWLGCLLYTSPSPRDATLSRMPSSA